MSRTTTPANRPALSFWSVDELERTMQRPQRPAISGSNIETDVDLLPSPCSGVWSLDAQARSVPVACTAWMN